MRSKVMSLIVHCLDVCFFAAQAIVRCERVKLYLETTNDKFENELDAIRLKLYEKTKNMSSEEQIAYLHKLTAPVLKKYGITPI
jgi:hypothetical protein